MFQFVLSVYYDMFVQKSNRRFEIISSVKRQTVVPDLIYELDRRWIAADSKQCPKCPWQIKKNDGCDHMKCIKCKHEFCWLCLADYEPIRQNGNHRHGETCKYYAAYHGRE